MTILTEPVLGLHPEEVNISNSEIQTYKKCRRRWYLGTYLGLAPKKALMLGPLPLGTRIHNALEAYYKDADVDLMDEYNRLVRIDNRRFLATPEAAFPENVDKFNDEAELGRIMVEGYQEWVEENNIDASIEVVGVEEILRHHFVSVDPRVYLIGKTDLKVMWAFDKTIRLFDHKSAAPSGFGDYEKYAYFSEQLMHYTLLEQLEGDPDLKVVGGTYNVLKKVKRSARAKPPFFMRIDVRFNKATMESFGIRLKGAVRDIMRTRDELDDGADHREVAYATQKMDWNCGTCPFFNVCNMLDDGSDAEGMLKEYFTQVDPNERYNEDRPEGEDSP